MAIRVVTIGGMDHVIAARAQMGTSLAFHIVFAALGVGLPLLVFLADGLHLRTRNAAYGTLARTWAKGMAILFAVGAVSGTMLSFELGLLWPTFMKYAGAIVGLPFSLEGFAFFIEAIFIGLYLYGRERLSPRAHWLSALPIAISGPISAGFVTLVNAWMQDPVGFRVANGAVVDVQPLAAMFSRPWATEVVHTTLAAYVFTGFGTAAVCAFAYWRGDRRAHIAAGLRIAMIVALIAIPLQILSGDISARFDAGDEPEKFAAMEARFHTSDRAPLTIGGLVGENGVAGAIEIPIMLSIMVGGTPAAVVQGLDAFAVADRPPVAATHYAFDLMVGSGFTLFAAALGWLAFTLRRRPLPRLGYAVLAACGPLALVALEAGWCVTEFGRQPWIARGLLRTSDAATIAPGTDVAFYGFSLIYVVLAITTWWLLRRIDRKPPAGETVPLVASAAPS
jgi:cytochrome d ubiquinol oxidase subunit I